MIKLAEKLIEIEEISERDQEKLENLIIKRGNLMAGGLISGKEAKIDSLNEEIKQLKLKVNELTPATISAFEIKIAQEKENRLKADKKALEKRQLEIEKELSEDSAKLILALEEILPLNKKVRDGWGKFNKSAKETGRKKLSGKYLCSAGSQSMLEFVANILISEFSGKKIQRQQFYNNVRL